MNAWVRVVESRKRIESFTKSIQGLKEAFTDILYRLTSAVNKMISDPDARQILIGSLTFENTNVECKRVIRPLRAKSAPIEEWIRHTIDIGPHTSKNDTWIGELLSKNMWKNQIRCFNYDRQGHLKREYRQIAPRNNVYNKNNSNREGPVFWKCSAGPLAGPNVKCSSIIPCQHWGKLFTK